MSDSEDFRRQTDKDIAHLSAKVDQMSARDESIIAWMRVIDGKMDKMNESLGHGATEFALHEKRIGDLEEASKERGKKWYDFMMIPISAAVAAAVAYLFGGGAKHP